jgi:hypothetical protein
LCGMALMDTSVEQGIWGVQHFMDHLFSRDLVGNLVLIVLRSLQLELVCGFHLLESPSKGVPYIMECWLTSKRFYLWTKNYVQGCFCPTRANESSTWLSCHGYDLTTGNLWW